MVWIRRLPYAVLCSLLFLACGDDGGRPASKKKQKEEEPEVQQGWLAILIHDLPDDFPAGVLVKGPEGFEKVVDASEVLAELGTGVYRVEAGERLGPAKRYAPSLEEAELEVKEGEVATLEITFKATDRNLFTISAKDVEMPLLGKADLVVEIDRFEGYAGAIDLRARGLPPGLIAEDATVPPGENQGRIPIASDGSLRSLKTIAIEVEAEAHGQRRTTEAMIRPGLIVSAKKDGAPGSLRSLLEIAHEIEGAEVPTITFDPRIFAKPTVLETESTLQISADVVMQGIPGDEAPRITLDGGESHTILAVSADVKAEIRDLGFRGGAGENGGAIRNAGTLTLQRVHIADSVGVGGGGINSFGVLIGEDLLIERCSCHYTGGGIFAGGKVVLRRARLLDNECGLGGGIQLSSGEIFIEESEFVGNKALLGGGGLGSSGKSRIVSSRFEGNRTRGQGGAAIFNRGEMLVVSSTMTDNHAEDGLSGGGMLLESTTVVMNSTIAGNTADADGGGIFVKPGAFLHLSHSTVAGNISEGAGIHVDHASMTMRSSIVWGNGAEEDTQDIHLDGSTLTSNGYNMIGKFSGAGLSFDPTDLVETDPLLLPLGDNGGHTWTMALQPDSWAVDRIPPENCVEGEDGILLVDQRGQPRPAGEGCDVGAYELQ